MVEQSDIGPGQSSVHVAIYPQFIDATNDFNKLEDSVASSCPEFSVMAESVSEENPDVGRQDELASLDSSYHAILGATSSQHLASQFASVATNTLIPRGHPPADVEEGRHRQFADNPVVSPLPTSFSDGDQASHDSSAPDTIPVDDGLNSSESDEMYTTPLADLASGYTWSLHHSDPDSDIDTDMSFLNALQPIVHATHDTDTDDGWHGGEMCEAPENESLIGPSSLHSFEIDKLPHDMIMSCNSNLMSELEGAKVHLEQFYPSDDEVPSIDSNENEAVSDLLEQKSAADLNPDFSLQPLPNDLPSMPLTQVDEYYEYNAADVSNDPGSLMHAASMTVCFLYSASVVFIPSSHPVFSRLTTVVHLISDGDGNVALKRSQPPLKHSVELVPSSAMNNSSSRVLSRILEVLDVPPLLFQKFFFWPRRGLVICCSSDSLLSCLSYRCAEQENLAVQNLLSLASCDGHDSDALRAEPSLEEQRYPQSSSASLISAPMGPHPPLLTEHQYQEIHQSSEDSLYHIPPALVLQHLHPSIASSLLVAPLAPSEECDLWSDANDVIISAFERNLTVEQFIRQWCLRSRLPHDRLGMKESFIPISSEAARVLNWSRPEKISRPENHRHRSFDIQNIPWSHKLNVKREDARMLRDRMYTSYHNLRYDAHGFAAKLPQKENYFKAKSMYTTFKASMAHFQLRNLMSVTASNTVQYVSRSKVYSVTPFYNHTACLMDLCDVSSSDILFDSVKISTMKSKHGVAIIGGFGGEYAYRSDMSHQSRVEGHITRNQNSITNHIDVVQHRTSRNPQAIISSNDQCIRILDCETNKFVRVQEFARAINCTDTSPDGRLRVIVGDSPDAWVVDSDSGKPLQALAGHQDYGFACAWSPDMLHIATSNQDKTVNIWDARMWRILQTIDSDVAGYRSLRFSPVGGGPRTLLMCEPADRIAIVNAQTYQTRQVHDFFGEIGGADYSPDGGRIWVANMDAKFGGLMEFDRCEWGQEFGIGHTKRRHIESRGDLYHPDLPNEWLPEADLDGDPRCVLGPGEREMRFERLSLLNDTADLDELLG
ncbi:hypothetical protein FQN57_003503 [Myotisia sp. PD_48]|nr:hypothetical protein FQN57_003503 [Myotisia sp. PD_48]